MSWDHFSDEWSNIKLQISFKHLPAIIVDDTNKIAQSIAILPYIEKLAGLELFELIIAAKADAILQGAQELFRQETW